MCVLESLLFSFFLKKNGRMESLISVSSTHSRCLHRFSLIVREIKIKRSYLLFQQASLLLLIEESDKLVNSDQLKIIMAKLDSTNVE